MTPGSTNFTPQSIDQLSPRLQRKWYMDRQIVAYKIFSGDPGTIKEWAKLVSDTIRSWPLDKPYLALHDLSHPGVALKYVTIFKNILRLGITEEDTQALQDIFQNNEGFQANVAIQVSLQFSGHLTSVFAQLESRRKQTDNIAFDIFTDEASSLGWLKGLIRS